ncbi:hypothetical protein [Chroococcidiopsis cubana]|uniref:hypothetical protein n=1 Tax=Chroococcidiopsis cubana TaxID=171392 RepID=UPI002ACED176|nr:hypothetical protein [Chroococcidiopsis cubana]
MYRCLPIVEGQGRQGELALPHDRREWGLGAKGDKGTRKQRGKEQELSTTNYPLPITHYHPSRSY